MGNTILELILWVKGRGQNAEFYRVFHQFRLQSLITLSLCSLRLCGSLMRFFLMTGLNDSGTTYTAVLACMAYTTL